MSFCKELQHAVKSGEKTKVATWISGDPIEVQHGATGTLVADDSDFVDKFDLIFDADAKRALLAGDACDLPLLVGTHVFRVGTINGVYLPAKTKPKGH